MTTSEVEALAMKAKEAYERDGATWAQVVESIARAVHAQDEARGGTLTEGQVDALLRECSDFDGTKPINAGRLREHHAAQGRTIAMLEKERDTARKAERNLHTYNRETRKERDEARDAMRLAAGERDEARDELAKAQAELAAERARAEMHGRAEGEALEKKGTWRTRATRAESALATLRQAVDKAASDVNRLAGYTKKADPIAGALRAALDATPAEHPDTATLRGIRERAKTWCNTGRLGEESRAALDFVLGDSGPSWGGEKPTAPPGVAACQPERETGEGCGAHGYPLMGGKCAASPDVAPREPDCAPCEGTGSASKDRSMYAPADCTHCAGSGIAISKPTPTPEEDWEALRSIAVVAGPSMTAALARLKAELRRAADSHGVVRPVFNCGHVNAVDGLCTHPNNMTPECHKAACPMLPEKVARRAAEEARDAVLEEVAENVEDDPEWVMPDDYPHAFVAEKVRALKSMPARRFVDADEVRRAAEAMRERCANLMDVRARGDLAQLIRDLSL